MSEQIFLNGAPVVGFGATEADEKKFYGAMVGGPLLGLIAGAGGGGVLGYKYGKGWGAAGGALVGGLAGGTVGVLGARYYLKYEHEKQQAATGVSAPTVVAAGLPWGEIVASSVVSAVAGFALDGIVSAARRRR